MKKASAWGLLLALTFSLGCVTQEGQGIISNAAPNLRYIEEQAVMVLDFVEGSRDALSGQPEALSPQLMEIAGRMRLHHPEIAVLKQQSCLGETSQGLVELRECDAIQDSEAQNTTQKVIAEENKDRKALYNEIVRLNRDLSDITVATVQYVYFLARLNRGHGGESFEMPEPGPAFDGIKGSAAGKRLGDQCRPSAWVTFP